MYKTVLFDEKRWQQESPAVYASFLEGVITDLIILVKYDDTSGMPALVEVMHDKGIKVHAAFNVCRANAVYTSYDGVSEYVDIHNTEFHEWITDIMADIAPLVDGVCYDHIRTDDFSDVDANVSSLYSLVEMAHGKIKSANPDCIISSTTTPYKDMTNTWSMQSGRRAIDWANVGHMDLLFDMNYGYHNEEDTGEPPNMDFTYDARTLTDTPVIVMVSSYKKNDEQESVPSDVMTYARVMDRVKNEQDIAIYTGWLFTKKHSILAQYRCENVLQLGALLI